MSIVALIMAILIVLPMHAWSARHTFDLVSYNKLQDDIEKTKLAHEMDINGSPVFKDTKAASSELTQVASSATLDKNTSQVMEKQGLKGRIPRSMMESESQEETKEAAKPNEGEALEDAVVMDYVSPHRKSPIHNHH
ncbi:unnamed protein product [Amaranthus hypochondriacus]